MKYQPNLKDIERMIRTVFKRESAFMAKAEFIAGLKAAGVKAIMMSPMGWAKADRDLTIQET
jgi:hypothetical protein